CACRLRTKGVSTCAFSNDAVLLVRRYRSLLLWVGGRSRAQSACRGGAGVCSSGCSGVPAVPFFAACERSDTDTAKKGVSRDRISTEAAAALMPSRRLSSAMRRRQIFVTLHLHHPAAGPLEFV